MTNYLSVYKPFPKEKQTGRKEKANNVQKMHIDKKPHSKPINKVSAKELKERKVWIDIKIERRTLLLGKFGYTPCEWCEKTIRDTVIADGHHNDHNRRNNTLENCRILHRLPCHRYVTDNNIRDVKSLL